MATLRSLNPLNGSLVGEVPLTPVPRISDLVDRARSAQTGWGALTLEERAGLLEKAAPRFRQEGEELGRLITREMGKPLSESIPEAKTIGTGLRDELVEVVEALQPEIFQKGSIRSVVHHDPLGVCAAITPWNFPMAMPNWMVLPALAAGNTVLFKPSEETPLCGQSFADILGEHLPEGVLTVVHGADEQGKALVRSGVDLVAFTGSREVGKEILKAASEELTRVILELGGKDPMIVLDDADLKDAAKFAAWNGFRNAGQVCVSTERIYVHKAIAQEFRELLILEAEGMAVGDGMEKGTAIGPMVNQGQRQHVLDQIDEAVEGGAEVVTRNQHHPAPFVYPTVLGNVGDDLRISREETFGPVVCVTEVSSDGDAIRKANATPFGLGAVVFGGDPARCQKVARQLTAGMIGINRGCGGTTGTPWVGARESGYGFHKGRDGHRQFTQSRVVTAPG